MVRHRNQRKRPRMLLPLRKFPQSSIRRHLLHPNLSMSLHRRPRFRYHPHLPPHLVHLHRRQPTLMHQLRLSHLVNGLCLQAGLFPRRPRRPSRVPHPRSHLCSRTLNLILLHPRMLPLCKQVRFGRRWHRSSRRVLHRQTPRLRRVRCRTCVTLTVLMRQCHQLNTHPTAVLMLLDPIRHLTWECTSRLTRTV